MEEIKNVLKKATLKKVGERTLELEGITLNELSSINKILAQELNPEITLFQVNETMTTISIVRRILLSTAIDLIKLKTNESVHVKFVIGKSDYSYNISRRIVDKKQQTFIT